MTTHDDFDELVRVADGTMIIVTASFGGERAGCLVGFHCQCSIEPARYAIWLSKPNHTCRIAIQSTHLGVHFLGREDVELARRFGEHTGDEMDKFSGQAVDEGPGGVPLLTECANRMVTRRVTSMDDGGDHICFVAEAVTVRNARRSAPLRLSDVSDFTPGHAAEDRPVDA